MEKTKYSGHVIEHIKHLAVEIGARGSTTSQERLAAEYCLQHFQSLGIKSEIQEFKSPITGWRQHSLAAILALFSIGLSWFGGKPGSIISTVIMILTTCSVISELYFKSNLLRLFIPKGKSQNVLARLKPIDEVRKQVLVVSHIDSHRTPWVFTTKNRLLLLRIITTLGTFSFFLLIIIFFINSFIDSEILQWGLLLLTPIFAVLFLITFQPDLTPFTKGANDNASGSAIILEIASKIAQEPLRNIEVWMLCTGSEEVGSYGIQAFIKEYKPILKNFWGINIDNVGGKRVGVCFTSSEGMIFQVKPSSKLVGLANQIKSDRQELNVYSLSYNILHTDGTCMMVNGIPTISFVGLTPEGEIPELHKQSDIFTNIEPETVINYEMFVYELIQRIDAAVEKVASS